MYDDDVTIRFKMKSDYSRYLSFIGFFHFIGFWSFIGILEELMILEFSGFNEVFFQIVFFG